jgi:hypothetical protein
MPVKWRRLQPLIKVVVGGGGGQTPNMRRLTNPNFIQSITPINPLGWDCICFKHGSANRVPLVVVCRCQCTSVWGGGARPSNRAVCNDTSSVRPGRVQHPNHELCHHSSVRPGRVQHPNHELCHHSSVRPGRVQHPNHELCHHSAVRPGRACAVVSGARVNTLGC